MISQEWQQVKELFEIVLDQNSEGRQAFLHQLRIDSPSIATEVARLISSHEAAGNFLNEPWTLFSDFLDEIQSEHRFAHGDILCNRFRIVRLIGKGGMGEVYEAWDQELETPVALKTLRTEVSTHEMFTARFRREIQLARKVTHPNVCRIFDGFKHPLTDGTYISVLSMELLQGQTLGQYLEAKGRLTAVEALPIMTQIANGLNAVHAAGIIHRDLKPSNLILVRGRSGYEVKITDFGIAGQLPTSDDSAAPTHASKVLGTPEYMAPEQLEGRPASVRSDVYSLGLILYEMVTGTKPFEGLSAWRRLTADPSSPRRIVPELPDHWNKTILCCLEGNPEYRFPSAHAVLDGLESDPSAAKFPPVPFFIRLQRATRGRIEMIATIFFLATSLVAGIYRYYNQSPLIPAGTTVLLTETTSNETNFSGLTLALKRQLEQSTHFQVAEESRIMELLQPMNRKMGDLSDPLVAREVATRGGFPLVIFSSLFRHDNDYVFSVTLQFAKRNRLFPDRVWQRSFIATSPNELLRLVNDASIWIRMNVGESASELSAHNKPLADERWEAFQRLYEADQKYKASQYNEAVLLLKEALHFDPNFAPAYSRLADILVSMKRYNEGYADWLVAVRLTDKQEFTSRMNLRIKGQYFEDIGDYTAAEEAFRSFTIHYPKDPMAWFYLGSILDTLERKEDAIDAFSRSASLDPTSYLAPVHLASLYLLLGKFVDSQTQIDKVRRLGATEWAVWLEAHSAFLQGQQAFALQKIQELRRSSLPEWKSKSYTYEANFLAELGRISEAELALSEGITFDQEHGQVQDAGDKQLALAYLLAQNDSVSEAADLALRATRLDNSIDHLLQAGTLLARAGLRAPAAKLLTQLRNQPAIPHVRFAVYRLQAEIELANRAIGLARDSLDSAARLVSPSDENEWLVHGLTALHDTVGARRALEQTITNPGRLWMYSAIQYPGIWSRATSQFLGISSPVFASSMCTAIAQEFKRRETEGLLRSAADSDIQAKYKAFCSHFN